MFAHFNERREVVTEVAPVGVRKYWRVDADGTAVFVQDGVDAADPLKTPPLTSSLVERLRARGVVVATQAVTSPYWIAVFRALGSIDRERRNAAKLERARAAGAAAQPRSLEHRQNDVPPSSTVTESPTDPDQQTASSGAPQRPTPHQGTSTLRRSPRTRGAPLPEVVVRRR